MTKGQVVVGSNNRWWIIASNTAVIKKLSIAKHTKAQAYAWRDGYVAGLNAK